MGCGPSVAAWNFTDGQRLDAQAQHWRALLCELRSGEPLPTPKFSQELGISEVFLSTVMGLTATKQLLIRLVNDSA